MMKSFKIYITLFLFLGSQFSTKAQNVGIGTNTPATRLHIVHSAAIGLRMDNPSATNSQIAFITQNTTRGYLGFLNNSMEFVGGPGTPVRIGADLQNHLIISTNGNINIGNNASPGERLVISNGNLLLQNAPKGIMLNGADRPMITRAFDNFTSGDFVGTGRWGVFMEPSMLTFGIPNIFGKGFQFKSYEANSTGTNILTIDRIGQVKRSATGNADLLPICIGTVNWNGAILGGTGNFTTSYPSTSTYQITITGHVYNHPGYIVLITPFIDNPFTPPNSLPIGRCAVQRGDPATTTGFLVRCYNKDDNLVERAFSFIVYKIN